MRGVAARSLRPVFARSYVHTRANFAACGATWDQLRPVALNPESNTTVGLPLPVQSMYSL